MQERNKYDDESLEGKSSDVSEDYGVAALFCAPDTCGLDVSHPMSVLVERHMVASRLAHGGHCPVIPRTVFWTMARKKRVLGGGWP